MYGVTKNKKKLKISKMKQRKFNACNSSSSSGECNGHVKLFKEINSDMFVRSTNGNRGIRNSEIKIDKTKGKRIRTQPQMKYSRSQRCLEHNSIVVQKNMVNNALVIYSKFAFHRIIHFVIVVVLLFAVGSPVRGQQQRQQQHPELRQILRNTGE